MVAVHDEYSAGASAVGAVHDHAAVAGLLHGALDRCGFRADNGDQPRRSDHIAKSDIDELHR